MKYLSIDCETTGIDHETCQILSIGLVIEDTNDIKPIDELPSLHLIIDRERIEGEIFALNLNKDLIELILSYQQSKKENKTIQGEEEMIFCKEHKVVDFVYDFLLKNGMVENKSPMDDYGSSRYGKWISVTNHKTPQITLKVAGKNFGTFDKLFLERLPRWKDVFKIHARVLDPANMFINWEEDNWLPNLNSCMERAGVDGVVTHGAVQDAKDVIRVLRTKY